MERDATNGNDAKYYDLIRKHNEDAAAAKHLESLGRIGTVMDQHRRDDSLVERVTDILMEATGAHRTAFFLCDNARLLLVGGKNLTRKTIDDVSLVSRSVVREARKNQRLV